MWRCTVTSAPSVLVSVHTPPPPRQTYSPPLPLSYTHPPCPAIIGSRAGRVIPQPEGPITCLPPAVSTSVLAATPIHYLPWSIAAHSSRLSEASSFTVWTPSRGGALVLSETRLLLIREKSVCSGSQHFPLTLGFPAGACLRCEQ